MDESGRKKSKTEHLNVYVFSSFFHPSSFILSSLSFILHNSSFFKTVHRPWLQPQKEMPGQGLLPYFLQVFEVLSPGQVHMILSVVP